MWTPAVSYTHLDVYKRQFDVQLGQVEDIAILVLTGGHDAGDHVGLVHVVGDAGQVLALPDLHVAVHAHAPDQKHEMCIRDRYQCVHLRSFTRVLTQP